MVNESVFNGSNVLITQNPAKLFKMFLLLAFWRPYMDFHCRTGNYNIEVSFSKAELHLKPELSARS